MRVSLAQCSSNFSRYLSASYQLWETVVLIHSAESVGQCGRFTWIVSGCLADGSSIGRGKGGANSDLLTPSVFIKEVEKNFDVTLSNHTVAREHDECAAIHPHVHFTDDYSDMSKYPGELHSIDMCVSVYRVHLMCGSGPYSSGKLKRKFVNRKGKGVFSVCMIVKLYPANFWQNLAEATAIRTNSTTRCDTATGSRHTCHSQFCFTWLAAEWP